MKKTFKRLFTLSIVLFILSCRTPVENDKIDGENISVIKPITVKINYTGAVWSDETMENIQYNENKLDEGGGNSLIDKKLHSKIHAVKINDDLYAEIKEIDYIQQEKNINLKYSLDLQSRSVPADPLEEGTKVRILVYDAQGEFYVKHIDYQIDSDDNLEGEKLVLDGGKKYTVYVISFNSSYLPESTDLSIPYEFGEDTKEFLHQKIENYTPDDVLNIRLKHRISQVNIVEYPELFYCTDPDDYDSCQSLLADDIDVTNARVLKLHHPKGTFDIDKGDIFPSAEYEPLEAYLLASSSFFPVIVSEEDEPFIEVKISYFDGYEPVLEIPLPKIPKGVRRSYQIKIKHLGERKISCKAIDIKTTNENIIEGEGECNVENLQGGDRVELSIVERGGVKDYGFDDYEKEIFKDTDYRPGNRFQFISHALTNCSYVGYSRHNTLVPKIKIFNSIGLVVGEYNLDEQDFDVGTHMYEDVLCREYYNKKDEGYCMDLEATNYGQQDDCEYLPECYYEDEDANSTPCRKPSSICESSFAINYGGLLPCKQLLLALESDPTQDFLVCDGKENIDCNSVSEQTFKLIIEVLSDEDFEKYYKLEASIVKDYPKGYLKDPIFQIKGLSKHIETEEEEEDLNQWISYENYWDLGMPYENYWDLEIAQNYVPYSEIYRMNTSGYFIVEVRVREISTNLVVRSTRVRVSVGKN